MKFSALTPSLKGIFLAISIALAAILIANWSGVNSILISLIIGVIVGNTLSLSDTFDPGIKVVSGLFLEIAIVLMAFGIDYGSFLKLGWQTILIIIITIVIVLWATLFLSKKMSCPSSAGLLVGFGTAICGSAAIAALAPSVSRDKSDMGIAMAVVNLYGLLGMIIIPFLTTDWLTDAQNSLLLGASLHSVGNVAGAGFAMSESIGEMAVTIKLGRVAMLTPALLIFGYFTSTTNDSGIKTKLRLPWYLVTFIAVSMLGSFINFSPDVLSYTKHGSNILLAIAMAGIGLKVSFKTLLSSGKKGLVFGAILFGAQLLVILFLIWVFNI